ncbi:hypothetical protein [uncultured Gammaproteobacteria bacterium]|uniref:hypothetical protein n=1 Tax=Bathymodiolus heckerae thiotrophic gill symbiont TaxID=1052212 RepID=UPI0010B2AD70|nr:hypothetical protein [Bathymodiolus heckerae thiotrophic gill symbiont]CAC9447040.1 hypothetical protein [uncultured Gammaproteobacteria bacterium]SMN12994.1 hypothetical protein BHECKSOX2_1554 [Bathymodiolus heckerae thiotrophic gill symbiont]
MEQKKKQETEYLYWSNGILLGILGSILGSFFVSSFFTIYREFDFNWKSIPVVEGILLIISVIGLLSMYLRYRNRKNKITGEHLRDFNQEKLNKELKKGRMKSAMSILKKDPSLNLNISKAIDIVLRKKENPLTFLEEYKEIKEIKLSAYSLEGCKEFIRHEGGGLENEGIGSIIVIERFFKNDYTKPFDDDFWRGVSLNLVSICDFFAAYHTTALLLYCLICNVTEEPITHFSMANNYNNQIEKLNALIRLLNKNPYVREDTKEILGKIRALNQENKKD